jgi:hypothetical protein
MQNATSNLPVVLEIPEATVRCDQWGEMMVETGTFRKDIDVTGLFKGLPDDRCQCPHWGYVVKGTMHYRFGDHDEVYQQGEVYYVAPGHLPIFEAGAEYIELSPAEAFAKTLEVVERNMAATAKA